MSRSITDIRLPHVYHLRKLFREAVALDFNYFPMSYREQVLKENSLLRMAVACGRLDRFMLGAFEESRLVGFVIGNLPANRIGQIHWLYVASDARETGIGGQLINALLERFSRSGASKVSLITHNYQDYYKKLGFKSGSKLVFSRVPVDVMWREI